MPTIHVGSESVTELQEIADVLGKARKVVVVTGAGISTNCGIPDFRSENGLYSRIQAQYEAASNPCTQTPPSDLDEPPAKRRRLTRTSSRLSMCVSTTDGDFETALSSQSSRDGSPKVEAPPLSVTKNRRRSKGKRTSLKENASLLRRVSSQSERSANSDTESTRSSSRRSSLPNLKGKDLFDSMIWTDSLSTSIFLTFIASLRRQIKSDVEQTTSTHKFLKTLRDGGRLVRCYTQNIDGLEGREGLCSEITRGTGSRSRFYRPNLKQSRDNKTDQGGIADGGCEVVELHGGLQYLRCNLCQHLHDWEDELKAFSDEEEEEIEDWSNFEESLLAGQAPRCTKCSQSAADRRGKGRRSLAIGRLRPDIVLYGEEHPAAHLIAPIVTHDLSLGPDILLILGTSLRVHGLKVMVREFAKAVHSRSGKVVFVNRTKPPDSIWGDIIDYWVENDCDSWVNDLRERRPEIWLPQGATTLIEEEKRAERLAKKAHVKFPRATRDNKENGAQVTYQILQSLGRLSGRIPLETEQKPSKKRKRQSTDSDAKKNDDKASGDKERGSLPSIQQVTASIDLPKASGKINPSRPITALQLKQRIHKRSHRPPLAIKSINIQAHRCRNPHLKLPPLRRDPPVTSWSLAHAGISSSLLPVLYHPRLPQHLPRRPPPPSTVSTNSQLPSPSISSPISSPVLPAPPSLPMTPNARRIKDLGSINAILSSPLKSTSAGARRTFEIWGNPWRDVLELADLPVSAVKKGLTTLRSFTQRN